MADSMAVSSVSSQSLGRSERKLLMVLLERRIVSKSSDVSLFSMVAAEDSEDSVSARRMQSPLCSRCCRLEKPTAYLVHAERSKVIESKL